MRMPTFKLFSSFVISLSPPISIPTATLRRSLFIRSATPTKLCPLPSIPSIADMTHHSQYPRDFARRGRGGGVTMSRPAFKPPPSRGGKSARYYAVQRGRDGFTGVLNTWDECKRYVTGISNAIFRSFKSIEEAQAYIQMRSTATAATPSTPTLPATGSATPPASRTVATGPSGNRPGVNRSTYSTAATAVSNPNPNPNPNPPNRNANPSSNNNNNNKKKKKTNNNKSVVGGKGIPECDLYKPVRAEDLVKDSPEPILEAPKQLIVYTDGGCINNGKRNAQAGYGVFFGDENPYNISAPLKNKPTNQRAEMTAVLEAMRVTLAHGLLAQHGKLTIFTDSKYTKDGITSWLPNWKKNGWKTSNATDVRNKEIWLSLSTCYDALKLKGIQLDMQWVKGHANVYGNEMADQLASAGIKAIP